jgi:reductive dehalogenase
MKKLTMEEWEKKYIAGNVERFDQKNIMFARPDWDEELKARLDDWFMGAKVGYDQLGWTLEERALSTAQVPLRGLMGLASHRKPNPSRQTKAFMKAMADLKPQMPGGARKPPVDAKIDTSDPKRTSLILKKVATYFGADLVGICRLDRRWVYSNSYDYNPYLAGTTEKPIGLSTPQEIPVEFQYAIVMAFEMDYDLLRYVGSAVYGAATGYGYSRMAITNSYVSEYLVNIGFKAINCTTNDVALTIPMAMQAGLGDVGRNGLLVTPEFGPRVRLSKVITNLPLEVDSPIEFGVTAFCVACEKCADHCPSDSIIRGDRTSEPLNASNVGGELKWPVNCETCRMYWSTSKKGGCNLCISTCPYNKVNTWPHKIVRWFTEHAPWTDKLLVLGDDMLGYGKPRSTKNFWKEWKPKRR